MTNKIIKSSLTALVREFLHITYSLNCPEKEELYNCNTVPKFATYHFRICHFLELQPLVAKILKGC